VQLFFVPTFSSETYVFSLFCGNFTCSYPGVAPFLAHPAHCATAGTRSGTAALAPRSSFFKAVLLPGSTAFLNKILADESSIPAKVQQQKSHPGKRQLFL
jgi:hypothetical protein